MVRTADDVVNQSSNLSLKLNQVQTLEKSVSMSSDELMGIERASSQLIDSISKRRSVTIATENSDALRYLNYRQAEAAALGSEDIIVRLNPSKAALL